MRFLLALIFSAACGLAGAAGIGLRAGSTGIGADFGWASRPRSAAASAFPAAASAPTWTPAR